MMMVVPTPGMVPPGCSNVTGAIVVTGPQTAVKLRRGGDVVTFDSNAIVEFRSGGIRYVIGSSDPDAVCAEIARRMQSCASTST